MVAEGAHAVIDDFYSQFPPVEGEAAAAAAPLLHCRVEVAGLLAKPELNGLRGTCVKWDDKVQRYGVRLGGNSTATLHALKPDNLRLVAVDTPCTCAELVAAVAAGEVSFDCILVLGGGVPPGPATCLPFVVNRCDAAVKIRAAHAACGAATLPPLLCLSAGTAHAPQLLSPAGLPVWEATVSAAHCLAQGVPASGVLVETTSYDTIGNAYFARTCHVDVAGWTKLLVVTSDFHMDRTKAIFDWVFGVPAFPGGADPACKLAYCATPDRGLSSGAVAARAAREAKSAASVRERLAPAHRSLADLRRWLATDHDLYSASGLAQRAAAAAPEAEGSCGTAALLESYGGGKNAPIAAAAPWPSCLALAAAAAAGAAAAALLQTKARRS